MRAWRQRASRGVRGKEEIFGREVLMGGGGTKTGRSDYKEERDEGG